MIAPIRLAWLLAANARPLFDDPILRNGLADLGHRAFRNAIRPQQ
jgi:hypothetical protein